MQRHYFSSIGVLLALAGLLTFSQPDSVRADTQIFPVPSVSTSKNDGNDAGLIAPILISDPDGELKYLMPKPGVCCVNCSESANHSVATPAL